MRFETWLSPEGEQGEAMTSVKTEAERSPFMDQWGHFDLGEKLAEKLALEVSLRHFFTGCGSKWKQTEVFRQDSLPLFLFLFPMDEVTFIGYNHPASDEFLRMCQMKVVVAAPGISFWFPDGDKSRPGSITISPKFSDFTEVSGNRVEMGIKSFSPLPRRVVFYKRHMVPAPIWDGFHVCATPHGK